MELEIDTVSFQEFVENLTFEVQNRNSSENDCITKIITQFLMVSGNVKQKFNVDQLSSLSSSSSSSSSS